MLVVESLFPHQFAMEKPVKRKEKNKKKKVRIIVHIF
jgi:hypothetical protein